MRDTERRNYTVNKYLRAHLFTQRYQVLPWKLVGECDLLLGRLTVEQTCSVRSTRYER